MLIPHDLFKMVNVHGVLFCLVIVIELVYSSVVPINNDDAGLMTEYSQKCDRLIDLYIVLDSSGSIGSTSFNHAKEALKTLVSRLEIGENKVMITVVNYASKVQFPVEMVHIPVNEWTIETMKRKINDIPYLGGMTATGDALLEVYNHCINLKKCRNWDLGASRTVLVFTDGASNTGINVAVAATKLKEHGKAEVFAVGIGSSIRDSELLAIATKPDYIRHVNDYLELTYEINSITIEACGIPAFVVTNVLVHSRVGANSYRFYQVDTGELIKRTPNSQGGFVEITMNMKKGRLAVFTSITDANPRAETTRQAQVQARGSSQYYLEYIDHDVSRLYFSMLGMEEQNQYEFELRWLDLNGNPVS